MKQILSVVGGVVLTATVATASPTLTINASEAKAKASPIHYGLMTEEINYCYDGGLYAELVRNRVFKDDPDQPVHWELKDIGSTIALDRENPLNDKLDVSLRWNITSKKPTRLANTGWWGIPVHPKTKYKASFYARSSDGFKGAIGVAIIGKDGKTVYAHGVVKSLDSEWKKYEVELVTGDVTPTADAELVLATTGQGNVWLNLVSLFPPTWNDRPNGLRKDLMQMLVDLNPKFLRFPGGNYLEGNTVEERFKWWETLGDLTERPGHPCPWGYRSSDGMGLHEFLLWTEDMGAEPVVGLYAGYNLDHSYIKPGPALEPYIKEALDEIEYIIGPVDSTWGAKRAAAGHPEPFPLRYVEIGNEDWFDGSGSYQDRFAQFYDAIKEKYPQLKCISSIGFEQPKDKWVKTRSPDVVDEHYYRSTEVFLEMAHQYDNYDRNGPEIFVGEWAAHEDKNIPPWNAKSMKIYPATPGMLSAIGDAAFMTAMERNSDIVTMQAYAPLFVNLNEYQWRPDLIGYNAIQSYGSPSYYALKMFSTNFGDEILATTLSEGKLHYSVTRDSKEGIIYIKLVNPSTTSEKVRIVLEGVEKIIPNAMVEVMAADAEATNSIENPESVVPVSSVLKNIRPNFSYQVPSFSIVVLKVKEALEGEGE